MPQYMEDEDSPEKQRLRETCRDGSVQDIIEVMGGDIHNYSKDGMMAHHLVALSEREDMQVIMEKLIKAGCDVNATTKANDDTVLHLIIANAPLKLAFPVVLKLLEYDPDLDLRNRNLRTPYDLAMAQGYYDLANTLDGSKTPEQARDYYTKQMGKIYGKKLIQAVLDDKEAEAIDCVYSGADCNILNEHGCGAMHYLLASYKHPPLKVLSAMMESNADVNLRDYEMDTVLNLTIKKTELRDSGEMYRIVEKLMGWGADPTCHDLDGNDAIALATKKNYLDILKLLRTKRKAMITTPRSTIPPGSVKNTPREPKPTPRQKERKERDVTPRQPEPKPRDEEPVQKPKKKEETIPEPIAEPEPEPLPVPPEIVEEPERSDDEMDHPPPNMDNEEEQDDERRSRPSTPRTPRWPRLRPFAAIIESVELGDDDELAALLDDPDADLNEPNEEGLFPIHVAVMRDDPTQRNQLVERLLSEGADVNARALPDESHNEGGNTPLHMAVARDQVGTVKLLLAHNPTYSVPNEEGLTPQDIAEQNGNMEIMQLLEDYKRRMDKSNKKGNSGICVIL